MLLLILTLLATPAYCTAPRIVVEAVQGGTFVTIRDGKGERKGEAGAALTEGDTVITDSLTSARIRFPDGSKLLLARDTEIRVYEPLAGVQFNDLKKGEVRGAVSKEEQANGIRKTPKFLIRTRNATMGVRGTDFVYDYATATESTELHTLNGVVNVSKDQQTVVSGGGTQVGPGQFVKADDYEVAEPRSFDEKSYMRRLGSRQPELSKLARSDETGQFQVERSQSKLEQSFGTSASPEEPTYKLLAFQVAAMFVGQKSGGNTQTAEIAWAPRVRLFGPIFLRGEIGAFPLKGRTQNDVFVAWEARPILSIVLGRLILEAGPGIEDWGSHGHTSGVGGVGLGWKLSSDRGIDRLIVEATAFAGSPSDKGNGNSDAAQLKAGLGISL